MFGLSLGDLVTHLHLDATQFDAALIKSVDRVQNFGKVATRVGGYLTVGLTLPLTLVGRQVTKAFAEFDDAITRSAAVTQKMSTRMREEMVKTALAISQQSILSATELAQGYFALGQAGYTAAQSIKALPVVEDFAIASSVNLDTAIRYLVRTMNGLAMASTDATKNMEAMKQVSDSFTYAAITTTAEIRDFAVAMTHAAAPALRLVHKSMEEGTAALMAFASAGIVAEEAGTLLWTSIRDLQRANIVAREEWDRLGIRVYDVGGSMLNLSDIFGQLEKNFAGLSDENKKLSLMMLGFQDRSLRGIQALMGFSEEMRKWEAEMRRGGDLTKRIAEEYMQSFAAQLKIVSNNIQVLRIELGKTLAPYLRKAGEIIKNLTKWFEQLSNRQKDAVVKWGIFAAAIGPVILVLGQLAYALYAVIVLMHVHPFVLLAIAAGAVALAITEFAFASNSAVKKIERMKESTADLRDVLIEVRTAADDFKEALTSGKAEDAFRALDQHIEAYKSALRDIYELRRRVGSDAVVSLKTMEELFPGKVDAQKYWDEMYGRLLDEIERAEKTLPKPSLLDRALLGDKADAKARIKGFWKVFEELEQSKVFAPIVEDVPKRFWEVWESETKRRMPALADLVAAAMIEDPMKRAREFLFILMNTFKLVAVHSDDAIEVISQQLQNLGVDASEAARAAEEFAKNMNMGSEVAKNASARRTKLISDALSLLKDTRIEQEYIDKGYEHTTEILEYHKTLLEEVKGVFYDLAEGPEKKAKKWEYMQPLLENFLAIIKEIEELERGSERRKQLKERMEALDSQLAASRTVLEYGKYSQQVEEYRLLLAKEAAKAHSDIADEVMREAAKQADISKGMEIYVQKVEELLAAERDRKIEENVAALQAEVDAAAMLTQSYSHATKIAEQQTLVLAKAKDLYKNIADEAERDALVKAYVTKEMAEYLRLVKEVEKIQNKGSLKRWIEQALDLERVIEENLVKSFDSLADALAEFISTGEMDWKEFTASLLRDWLSMLMKMKMAELAKETEDLWVSFIKGFANALGYGPTTAPEFSGSRATASAATGGASGMAFQPVIDGVQIMRLAAGDIINAATMVPLAQKRVAYIGEAGPEGVLPLTRTAEGDLGVKSVQGQPPQVKVDNRLKIVNVMTRDEMYAAMQTDQGERIFVNWMRKHGVI